MKKLLKGLKEGKVWTVVGLVGLLERGEFKCGDRVLFIHTGGLPSLFTHYELFG